MNDYKRNIIAYILLLPILLILANNSIPHHHHKSEVCIGSSHCETDCELHKHGTTKNDHKHNSNNNYQCCVLIQDVILPSNYINQESKRFNYVDNQPDFDGYKAILFNSGLIRLIPPNLPNTLIPLISSSYSYFVSTSLGLRAPPIV